MLMMIHLFRHSDLVRPRGKSKEEFEFEQYLKEMKWKYIEMDGDIGILSSGAGITMAILDLDQYAWGQACQFLGYGTNGRGWNL